MLLSCIAVWCILLYVLVYLVFLHRCLKHQLKPDSRLVSMPSVLAAITAQKGWSYQLKPGFCSSGYHQLEQPCRIVIVLNVAPMAKRVEGSLSTVTPSMVTELETV